jgi:hypothetical protein
MKYNRRLEHWTLDTPELAIHGKLVNTVSSVCSVYFTLVICLLRVYTFTVCEAHRFLS